MDIFGAMDQEKPAHPLSALRAQIDAIDDQVLALLARRYALLGEVVKVKAAHGIPHLVQARVIEVLERTERQARTLGLPEGYARQLWQLIIDAAHDFERARLPD